MFAFMKTSLVGATAALAIAAAAVTPADALGKRDRDIILGLTTAVIIGALINDAQTRDRGGRVQVIEPEPQYFAPEAPVVHAPVVRNSIYRTPAAVAFNGYSREERFAIQRKLAAYGYYRRGVDGSFGPGTYNAVLAFAADNGLSSNLQSTGEARGIYDALIY
jgi:hypothetical protein